MKLPAIISSFIQRINWQITKTSVFGVLLLLAIYPILTYMNPQLFIEDGIIENFQLLILAIAFIIALKAPKDKNIFTFLAFLIIFMVIRETNMGRGYFCKAYFPEQSSCRWSDFKYGYIAEIIRAIYVIFILFLFFSKKVWQTLWQYVKSAPIFIWDFAVFALVLIGAIIAEFRSIDNEVLEETCETIMYFMLTCLIWHYSRTDKIK